MEDCLFPWGSQRARKCDGRPLVSTLTFQLHVTRARVVGDTWYAASLEGHLTQREGEQLGCRAACVDFTVRLLLYAGQLGLAGPNRLTTVSYTHLTLPTNREV